MSTRFAAVSGSLTLAVVVAATAAAQAPRIANGRIAQQPAGSPFAESFRTLVGAQADVAWIGYAVPTVETRGTMCCAESGSHFMSGSVIMVDSASCCMSCRLEPSSSQAASGSPVSQPPGGPIRLEPSDQMTVLFRIAERRVDRIRVFSTDCQLDAGGRPVVWLENVRPSDSIGLLESLVTPDADRRDRVMDGAVSAIALHRDPAADTSLERMVAASQPAALRKKVTFWLGQTRGARGLAQLRRIVNDDASVDVRKGAVFGISQSREPDAETVLIDTARNHTDRSVRGEAIFWLGQKAGAKAAGTITDVIEQDPDTEIKKRAVFALSQLPKGEGVPLLIKVARTNPNREVRKQAMFWLGQSRDPRAVDFFAEILKPK